MGYREEKRLTEENVAKHKPYKIKLDIGDKRAQNMYILLNPSEVK